MQFSLSFYIHFVLSLAGFLAIGIYLCRGSWRNSLHKPLALGFGLIAAGHIYGMHDTTRTISYAVLAVLFGGYYIRTFRQNMSSSGEVRGGHNAFSLMVGAALFGLAVQLHYAVTGVSVFELVK